MDRPRRDSRQHNGITVCGLSQPTFATKSAKNGNRPRFIRSRGNWPEQCARLRHACGCYIQVPARLLEQRCSANSGGDTVPECPWVDCQSLTPTFSATPVRLIGFPKMRSNNELNCMRCTVLFRIAMYIHVVIAAVLGSSSNEASARCNRDGIACAGEPTTRAKDIDARQYRRHLIVRIVPGDNRLLRVRSRPGL